MATPPKLGAGRDTDAIASITARRERLDDPDRWRLSDNPLDVLDYLRAHPARDLPPDDARAEVLDGLALTVALWWRWRRDELMLLERAEQLGMLAPHSNAWRPIGELLGITTARGRRGLLARLDRLRELIRGSGVPSERLWRDRGHQLVDHRAAGDAPAGAGRAGWLDEHREQLRQVAADLYAHRGHPGDVDQWLDELREFPTAQHITPGMVTVLRYAAATLLDVEDQPVRAAIAELGGLLDGYPAGD